MEAGDREEKKRGKAAISILRKGPSRQREKLGGGRRRSKKIVENVEKEALKEV